jgi:hypothetical protein
VIRIFHVQQCNTQVKVMENLPGNKFTSVLAGVKSNRFVALSAELHARRKTR